MISYDEVGVPLGTILFFSDLVKLLGRCLGDRLLQESFKFGSLSDIALERVSATATLLLLLLGFPLLLGLRANNHALFSLQRNFIDFLLALKFLYYRLGDRLERLLDALARSCAGFEELHVILLRRLPALLLTDDLFF